jgi:hypothetical protein
MPRRRRRSPLAKKYRKNPAFSKSKKRRIKRRRFRVQVRRSDRRDAPRYVSGHQRHWQRNPAFDWETWKPLGVGFAGFAGSCLLTRIASVQVEKRKPTWGRHAGVVSSAAAFVAALLLARKWQKTAPYETSLQYGTGIALAKTVIQTYFPKLGWMVTDASPEVAEAAQAKTLVAPQTAGLLPDDEEDDEDGWYQYNDAYDHGRHAKEAQPRPPVPSAAAPARPAAPAAATDDDVDDLLAELSDDDGGGVFAN